MTLYRKIVDLTESHLARDSLTSVFVQFSNSAFSLVTAFMFARLLGASEFGAYTVAFSWPTLLSILGRLGLDTYITRELAIRIDQKNWAQSLGLLITVFILTIIVSLLLALSAYQSFIWLDPQIDPALKRLFGYSCLLVPAISADLMTHAVLKAAGHNSAAVWIRFFIRPLLLIAVLSAATMFQVPFTGVEAILSQMSVILIGLALLLVTTIVLLPKEITSAPPEFDVISHCRGGLRFLVIAGLSLLITNTDIVMLGFISTLEEAGNYRVASRVASVIGLSLFAISLPLGPRFAILNSSSKRESLREIYYKANALGLIFAIPLCILFIVFSSEIMSIFGDDFLPASPLLIALSLTTLFQVFIGPAALCLSMAGKENKVTSILAVAAVLNVLLNLVLIPKYGAWGAVVASAITMLVWNLVIWLRLYLEFQILPGGLGLLKHKPADSLQ